MRRPRNPGTPPGVNAATTPRTPSANRSGIESGTFAVSPRENRAVWAMGWAGRSGNVMNGNNELNRKLKRVDVCLQRRRQESESKVLTTVEVGIPEVVVQQLR